MALTVAQLLAPPTPRQARASVLDKLSDVGFPVTSWQSGSIARTLIEMVALMVADSALTIQRITRNRFNEEATGDWLTLLSSSFFDNTRGKSVRARLKITVSNATAGSISLNEGQVLLKDYIGNVYSNAGNTAAPAHGSVDVTFEAQQPGASARGVQLVFVTPLAGCTITAAALIRRGVDEESDAKLRARNRAKWATLAYGAPADAYVNWALTADGSITRVYVQDNNPRGNGSVNVYIAGNDDPLTDSSNEALAAQAYIDARAPIGSHVLVRGATLLDVAVNGTLYVDTGYDKDIVLTTVKNALDTMMDTVPIGGVLGKLPIASVYRTIMMTPGVVNVDLTAMVTALGSTAPKDIDLDETEVPAAVTDDLFAVYV